MSDLRFNAIKLVMENGSEVDKTDPFQKAQAIIDFVRKEDTLKKPSNAGQGAKPIKKKKG